MKFETKANIFFIVVVVIVFVSRFVVAELNPASKVEETKLVTEYRAIEIFPGSIAVKVDTGHRFSEAWVHSVFSFKKNSMLYNSKESFNQIKDYYKKELRRRGWSLKSEKDIKEWGSKDLTAKSIIFDKGKYELTVFYPVKNKDFAYSLVLEWKNH